MSNQHDTFVGVNLLAAKKFKKKLKKKHGGSPINVFQLQESKLISN